jgi:hypothetical protein
LSHFYVCSWALALQKYGKTAQLRAFYCASCGYSCPCLKANINSLINQVFEETWFLFNSQMGVRLHDIISLVLMCYFLHLF